MLVIEDFIYMNFDRIEMYGNPTSDLRVDCPFCAERYGKADYKQKLYVSLNKQVVHCFKCEYKASWIKFAMDCAKLTYYQALGELYTIPNPANIEKIFQRNEVQYKVDNKPIKVVGLWNEKGCKYLSAGRKYAKKRGLDNDKWNLYGLGVSDDLPYRLIIPVEGDYYQARAFYSWQEPKYKNPPTDKDDYIFNSGAMSVYSDVVICEGIFSAISVGLNAIATLGVNVTTSQLKRMIESPVERFVIAFDAGAEKLAMELADKLVGSKEVIIWKYVSGDPDDNKDNFISMEYSFKTKVQLALGM